MIDKDTKMNINHLKSLPNIQMAFFDMFKKEKIIEFVTKQTKNKIGLFVGTHLCGMFFSLFFLSLLLRLKLMLYRRAF